MATVEYYIAIKRLVFTSTAYTYRGQFNKELALVLSRARTRPNLGLFLRSACYSAWLGLVLSP